MNIRKNIDYSEMYVALDTAIVAGKEQMKLYTLIGQAVCRRTEKGAAVSAAEYLRKYYPDVQGFLPETCVGCGISTAPMKPSCSTVPGNGTGGTQNVVVMEADLTMGFRIENFKDIQ